jgi:flagellar hook-associated protein 3 FlgL
MTNISSKLFNQQVMNSLKSLDSRISELQNETSTGLRTISASADPILVSELNTGKELLSKFDRYLGNAETANDRLKIADTALQAIEPLLARFSELNIQANNDTLNHNDRLAIKSEVDELRSLLLDLANTRDNNDVAIFGGTIGDKTAFSYSDGGRVEYFGDQGNMSLKISDNKNVETSISGLDTFMNVQTSNGVKSVFDIIDNFSDALEMADSGTERIEVSENSTLLQFQLADRPAKVKFQIFYNGQSHNVEAKVVNGHLENLKTEIEKFGLGLRISYNGGNAISIATNSNSSAVLSDLAFDPLGNSDVSLFKIDVGDKRFLQSKENMSQSLEDFNEAISHVSVKHATLGAKIQAVTTQTEILQQFKMTVSEDVSELQDADLAEVVTELKQLLLNKDAAQQVYAKLNQQTLFDFIR